MTFGRTLPFGQAAKTQTISGLTNNLIAIFGDSRVAQCSSSSSGVENYGFLFWALFLSRQRARFDMSWNFGVGGDTTTMMLARIAPVIASPCGIVVVFASTNDRGSANMTAEQTIANLAKIRDMLRSSGKTVIFIAETPRGDTTFTDKRLAGVQLGNHLRVRQWILSQHGLPGVYVADPWPAMALPSSATGDSKTGMHHDGLHPLPLGAYHIGEAVARVLSAILPEPSLLPASNADVHSADNPLGCINLNPMVAGTGGAPSTGGSGQLADSWSGTNASGASGVTRVYSKVTAGSVEWQQCVLGGTASGSAAAVDIVRQIGLQAKAVVGSQIEAVGEIEIDAGAANVMSVQLGIVATTGAGTVNLWDGDRYTGAAVIPAVAMKGVLRTPRFTVPDGMTDLRLRLTAYVVDSGSPQLSIRCRALSLRRVE